MTISVRNASRAKSGLHDMCKYLSKFYDLKKLKLYEIGSYAGDAAGIFAQYFKRVYCIDPWENGYDDNDASSHLHPMPLVEAQFDKVKSNFQNIEKYKMKGKDFIKTLQDESIDMVYIDAIHTYEAVIQDIKMWYPKVKLDGYLLGHDYKNKHHPGVEKAVHNIIGIPEKRFDDSSWIKSKNAIVTSGGLKI